MGNRKKREQGPQQHAEGDHGEKTHRRIVEQLQDSVPTPKSTEGPPVPGHHRLHEDRIQHDEAEKGSEKARAINEIERGRIDENVMKHAGIPAEDL